MTTILIVDDDLALADVLAFTLRRAAYDVKLAHDGRAALQVFEAEQPDLVVLDWNLPHLDGLSVGKQLRAQSHTPIIMLTVRDADQDVIAALEACADDYVTKPFSPRELVARVRAVLRRTAAEVQAPLRSGPLSLEVDRREARLLDGPPISLSRLETRLLQALMQNAGRVLTTETLIVRVWGQQGATRDMLKQLVYRLRKKVEDDPSNPRWIITVPDSGYLLGEPPQV
jgi:DNA-binding response OmpR family regulator